MAANTQSAPERTNGSPSDQPAITLCESRPERFVLIEDGNTDGWLATDLLVAPTR